MCGIAGILSPEGINPTDLFRMSEVLRHRGPDDEGFSLFDKEGKSEFFKGADTIPAFSFQPHIQQAVGSKTAGLSHRRLSILDLSETGHQPMTYGKNQVIFNGEIYNYKEIRDFLMREGYSFRSGSDTEVILAAYDKWGHDCVNRFVGMWAFALYDGEKKEFFLSRDRFGIKPLYFSKSGNKFAFASEIKALLCLDFIPPEADMKAVYEFLCFGAASDPSANLFRNISVLPPSHNLVVSLDNISVILKKYYDLEQQVKNFALPPDNEIQKTFTELLTRSIELHLRSDVPVGSALSGGLDSSTLVAMAAGKMEGKTFKTFTAAYHEKNIDESGFARKAAASRKNIEPHFIYPDSSGYWNDLDKLIWHQDLPIGSTSMYAQWEVMKLARQQHMKVLLDGQGADEILGGYYNFAGLYLVGLAKALKFRQFGLERSALKVKFAPDIDKVLGRVIYYFLPGFMQRSVRARARLGLNFIAADHRHEIALAEIPLRGGKTFRQQSLLSTQYGLQDLLRYEDRNSMAFSIESRVPFLDHRLVEFCIALKNDWKIRDGWTKYILRKTAEPVLDKEVTWRKYKMGFLTPQKEWKERSQKELDAFVNETEVPAFIDRKYLLELNLGNLTQSAHLSEFWKMISFLKWARLFKVSFH